MKHLGDITKLSGYVVPAVDVVIGGSPCQGLSVAGKQAGLKDERSGLFIEQIRLVKEMRKADAARGKTNDAMSTNTRRNRMPRYDVFLEGRTESSTCYFGVAVMADDQKEAEFLGHEAGRVKHQEYDEIEVVGVMPVTSTRNAGKGRLCQRVPLKERALKFVKEAIKNDRKKAH